jgi:hypothetical protein
VARRACRLAHLAVSFAHGEGLAASL